MANEIADALNRAVNELSALRKGRTKLSLAVREEATIQTLLALVDAVAEIANVLPEPHRVAKE